jgi:light-regulated signal transduction histidine kinase (bacteriophytochrome)
MDDSERIRLTGEISRLQSAIESEGFEVRRRLDRADAEFERFVSTAVHNLREPLREVAAYTELLAESGAGRLPEQAALLQRIQKGAAAMQSLLAGMLEYSAVGSATGETAAIDLEAVLDQALLCTEAFVRERGASVSHGPLPRVTGDFQLLAKIFEHLIRNAVGYCEAVSPEVHISAARLDSECVLSVRDNGPGIDPAFQDRIFEPFRRLHGPEYPGTGLGLALCRRAVEWHGGRIWLESAPPAGSTFYFTLPVA